MRYHRWSQVRFARPDDWEHHAFPSFGRPNCNTTLCGKHFVSSARPQRGAMENVCKECVRLLPAAEAAAAAGEARKHIDDQALIDALRSQVIADVRNMAAEDLMQVRAWLRARR